MSSPRDVDAAFVTKTTAKHRKKPPAAAAAAAAGQDDQRHVVATAAATATATARASRTSDVATAAAASPHRTMPPPSVSTTLSASHDNASISLRPRTMFAMKGRGRTESEGAAYRPQWSKDGEGFVSSSTASTAAVAAAAGTALSTSGTGPLSMKDAVVGGSDDHRTDRRKTKVVRYSKEELLALHSPTNELPAFLVETSVASEHSLPPVGTLPFDYEEIYKQWSLNRNRGRGRGRSNAASGAAQGTRGHHERGARGDETLDGAMHLKDEGLGRPGHKERDSMWERGAKITEGSSRGDGIWDDVLEPGTDSNEMDLSSMAEAAELFRREMDAMRDELQGPRVDPNEIKDDLDAFDKKLEDAAAAGQFDDSDNEEASWGDPAPGDQHAADSGNNLSDVHAANSSEQQPSDSHLFDALEPADAPLVLEEKGSSMFSQASAEASSAGLPSSGTGTADEWFYLDPQGLQRGPFKTAEMREWFEAGYFKPHLPIRFGQHGIFTALANQFVPGQLPFATLPTRMSSVGGIHLDPIQSEQQRLLELQHEQQRQQQMLQLQQQQQQQRMLQVDREEKIRMEMQRLEIARQQQQTQLYQQQQILHDQQEKQRQQQQHQQQQQQQFFLQQQQNSWQLSQREGIMSALGIFGGNQDNVAPTDSFRTDGMQSQFRSDYHTHHQLNMSNVQPVAQNAAFVSDEAQRRTQAFWPSAAPETPGLENVTSLGMQSVQPVSPAAAHSAQLPEPNRSAPAAIPDAWARRQKVPGYPSPMLHDIQVEEEHRAAQESRNNDNQATAPHGQPENALSAGKSTKMNVTSGGDNARVSSGSFPKNGSHAENSTTEADAWAIGTAPTAASSKSVSLKDIQQEEQRELLEKRHRDKGDTAHLAQMGAQLKMMLGVDSMAVPPSIPSASVPQATVAKSTAPSTSAPTSSSPSPAPGPWGRSPAVVSSDKSKSMRDILAEEERLAQERAKANVNAPVSSQWVNIVAGNKAAAAAIPKPSRSVLGPVPASVLKSRQQVRATNGALKPPPAKTGNDASFWNFGAATQPTGKESAVSVGSSNAFGSNSVSSEFMAWASKQLKTIDVDANVTLLEYCASVEDPGEVREYLAAYLGSTPRVSAFATEFIQRKKSQSSGKKSPGHQDAQQRASEMDSSTRRGKRRS
ncbi:unnamed protein product [Hyaloperonospora brassicae]|uniref:GYF domain-containing protein n=1 Tax=Hyaloperonospora brassicae TaxID=162125 RepID=A0AAV0UAW7_HYABA|nr:unnamed protein product [Hyaloperonospora brassicae]